MITSREREHASIIEAKTRMRRLAEKPRRPQSPGPGGLDLPDGVAKGVNFVRAHPFALLSAGALIVGVFGVRRTFRAGFGLAKASLRLVALTGVVRTLLDPDRATTPQKKQRRALYARRNADERSRTSTGFYPH